MLAVWLTVALAEAQEASPPYRAVLDNGLTVLFQPNSSALTLAVDCVFRATARVERRDTAGLRRLAQAALLDLPDASGQGLEQRAARQGIAISAQTSPDCVETVLVATADQLDATLGYVREMLTASKVVGRQLALRRAQVLREAASRRELPETVALDAAQAYMHRGTSCAWPTCGDMAVAGLQPEQVSALWQARFAPNNAVLAISGNLSWADCQAAVRRALGDLLPRSLPPEPQLPATSPLRRAVVYQPWRGDNAVVMMATACPRLGAADFPAAALVGAVLGSGEGSRLFLKLRQEQGWAYSVTAEIAPSALCGILAVTAVCDPERAADVYGAMQAEVVRLGQEPPTAAEVARAQAYLSGRYLLARQRNAQVAHQMVQGEILGPGLPGLDLPGRLTSVTPAAVGEAARGLAGRAVWVQVGGKRPQ